MSMFISGSSTSTGSFAHIRGGGGTTTDNQTKISFEISSRKKYAANAMYDVSLVDGDTRKSVFSAHSGSGGYYSYLGDHPNGYSFGYLSGWTGKLYMQSQHILTRNAGANQPLTFAGTGGITVPKIILGNGQISGSSTSFDFYTYNGGKFDIRSYYNETFKFRVNSGTAAAPDYQTRMIFGNRAGGGKIGLGGVTSPTEAVHIGPGSNLRNTGSFGDVRLYVDGNISGSASSTGSFGSVFVGNINNGKSLSIGDNTRGNHKIYDNQGYLRFDSSIWLGNGYIYVGGTLNLDAGANDIRLGSSSGGANTVHFKTDGSTDGTTITKNHITASGNFSSSLASTGSFGRVEGTTLAAGDNFINSNRLRIQTTSRHFGVSGNQINMTANGSAITSGAIT